MPRSSLFRSRQVNLGQVMRRLIQVMSGQVNVLSGQGHVMPGQVRTMTVQFASGRQDRLG